jgi:hypothetical protein
VYWCTEKLCWRVEVRKNGQKYLGGNFAGDELEEAKAAVARLREQIEKGEI